MEDWLKCADFTAEKLRLRTTNQCYRYKNLKSQLLQKEELGIKLTAIDFEQMRIQNRKLQDEINKKTKALINLKRKLASLNMLLTKKKTAMQYKRDSEKKLSDKIEYNKLQYKNVLNEEPEVIKGYEQSADNLEEMRKLTTEYTVSCILRFVKLILAIELLLYMLSRVYSLNREFKIKIYIIYRKKQDYDVKLILTFCSKSLRYKS